MVTAAPVRLTPARIDGEPVEADEVIEVRSPWDGRLLGAVPACGPRHLDEAVSVALDRHRGPRLPAHQRAAILDRVAEALAGRREEFARLIAGEAAKPITTARAEAARAVDTVRFAASVARTLGGEVVPLDASSVGVGKLGLVKRVPVGVVAAITPSTSP